MPADPFLPAHAGCRLSAHPLPTLTGDEPGLSSVRTGLPGRRGSKGGAGAPLTQVGASGPDIYLGPTAAYAISVRSRASNPTTTTKGLTTLRRVTRTIQHLIAGSVANHRVTRADAVRPSVALTAQREEREGFDARLAAHRATYAPVAPLILRATTTAGGRTGGWAGPESPGAENVPGEWSRVSAPRTGELTVADTSSLAAGTAAVGEAEASASEGVR